MTQISPQYGSGLGAAYQPNLGINDYGLDALNPYSIFTVPPKDYSGISNPLLNFLSIDCEPTAVKELRELVSKLMKHIDYTPKQIKDLNAKGVYTSAEEMTPEMLKNITEGKVKNLEAGKYGGVKLSQVQINNARIIAATIVDEGRKLNKTPAEIRKAIVIALATAMQESSFKNLAGGMDGDNAGLFQQRDGWGSKTDRLDPVYATRKFAKALFETNYMNKSVTDSASGVQKCAAKYKDEYAKWQNMAEALATQMLS